MFVVELIASSFLDPRLNAAVSAFLLINKHEKNIFRMRRRSLYKFADERRVNPDGRALKAFKGTVSRYCACTKL